MFSGTVVKVWQNRSEKTVSHYNIINIRFDDDILYARRRHCKAVFKFSSPTFFATKNFVTGPEAVCDYFNGFSIAIFYNIIIILYRSHKLFHICKIISNYVFYTFCRYQRLYVSSRTKQLVLYYDNRLTSTFFMFD